VAFVRHDARRWVRVAAWPLAGLTACALVPACGGKALEPAHVSVWIMRSGP
jgi:hypothetical protein